MPDFSPIIPNRIRDLTDTPMSAPTAGVLLIGKEDGTYNLAGLTPGSNITITPGDDGTITIAATGASLPGTAGQVIATNGSGDPVATPVSVDSSGVMSGGERSIWSLNNTDYVNSGGSGSILYLKNPNSQGQNVVYSEINGNLVAKWRTDYQGNIQWVAGQSGSQDFYTGGDYPSGHSRLTIRNNGWVGIGIDLTPTALFDVNNKFTVDSSGSFTASGTATFGHRVSSGVTSAGTQSGGSYTIDASAGNQVNITLGADLLLAAPTNAVAGQPLTIWLQQPDSGSLFAWSLATGTGGFIVPPSIILFPAEVYGAVDVLTVAYDAVAAKWRVIAYTPWSPLPADLARAACGLDGGITGSLNWTDNIGVNHTISNALGLITAES